MSVQERRSVRCAIYTRKSSEEGLEQSFNSLDAQREACLAFIQSQRQEGWRAITGQYDDGGYSGGSMERPGLKQLLADIDARKIDTVVVYKVDRLTRSLADFAKIIESFDARGVSFVSVTQQFNTTSSMGRLTLNVLLSFAQFEREVTGERIRDKIAASKRKGMWMGGCIPLGYDLKDRRLMINEKEAEQIRNIFRLYLEFGCVKNLKAYLDVLGAKSKIRISRSGNKSGGRAYSRGALYKILQNKTYLGEVPHKEQSYPGEHEAIIDLELWEKVRTRMNESIRGKRHGRNAAAPSLLRGLVFDAGGKRLTPSHAVKRGRRYRYYVSQRVIEDAATTGRIPAQELEKVVLAELKAFFASADQITSALCDPSDDLGDTRQLVEASQRAAKSLDSNSHEAVSEFIAEVVDRIVIHKESVAIQINREALRTTLLYPDRAPAKESAQQSRTEDLLVLDVSAKFRRCRGEMRLIIPSPNEASERRKPIPSLVKAIARAQDWVRAIVAGEHKDQRAIAAAIGVNEQYVSHVIAGAFLAPGIVESILRGSEEISSLSLPKLLDQVPLSWIEQYRTMGNVPDL
jgi:DNA invertase Pin-like site-specific DNA recombinase